MEKPPSDSVGIVKVQYFTFADPPNEMALEKGGKPIAGFIPGI